MKLRNKISKYIKLHINDEDSLKDYLEMLNRQGRFDSKTRMKLIILLCDHIDKQEK